jgi:hypothetical protein
MNNLKTNTARFIKKKNWSFLLRYIISVLWEFYEAYRDILWAEFRVKVKAIVAYSYQVQIES